MPVPTENPWLHTCPALCTSGWAHGWTDQGGPDFKTDLQGSAHRQALVSLCREVGLADAAWAEQVHGGTVLKVETAGPAGQADALWTDRPELGVVGRSADCPLVLVAGVTFSGNKLAGIAHASWRSTVRNITGSLVSAMTQAGAVPLSLQAVICPSAGPCCYQVGEEVLEEACARLGDGAALHFHQQDGHLIMDLWSAASDQLVQGGVEPARIHWSGHCTICGGPEGDLSFPSYRRQGETAGRFAAILGFTS